MTQIMRGFTKSCAVFLFFMLSTMSIFADGNSSFVVVLDAGHGGHDPGAVGTKINEKELNLAVILMLGELIEKNHADVKVVYTRKTDVYLTLQERADVANNAHADLFISIHTNANNNKSAYGSETYTLGLTKSKSNLDVAMRENAVILLEDDYKVKYQGFNPKSVDSYIMFECIQDKYLDKSVQIAQDIQSNFVGLGRKDRGVRQAGFWVLHKTAMPSVLIELGYVSNPDEQQFLMTKAGQTKMAAAIYSSFETFKKEYQRKSGQMNYVIDERKSQDTKSTKEEVNKQEAVVEPVVDQILAKSASESQKVTVKESITQVVSSSRVLDPEKIEGVDSEVNGVVIPTESEAKPVEVSTVKSAFNSTKPVSDDEVVYKLQLFAVSKKQPATSSAFKGLTVDYYRENNMYKYTYGSATDLDAIRAQKKKIADKFPGAMVIAFKNGKKVPLSTK